MTLVEILKDWEPAATIGSAVFTAIAASAAAVGAWEARRSASEAQATRLQSAEPYLRVLIGQPNFTFSWRPQTGEPPKMITSYTTQGYSQPSIQIANFGGGPALDLRISICALEDVSEAAEPLAFIDPGGLKGAKLVIHPDRLEATAPNTVDGVSLIEREQRVFHPACGPDERVDFIVREQLLARLLPLTLELERRGYDKTGAPPDQGRIRWNVRVECRNALGKPIQFDQVIYAERSEIRTNGQAQWGGWLEKGYRCTLVVEPTDGFQATPGRVDVAVIGSPPMVLTASEPFQA